MEEETSGLKQILQGMANSVKADDDALSDFREVSVSAALKRWATSSRSVLASKLYFMRVKLIAVFLRAII